MERGKEERERGKERKREGGMGERKRERRFEDKREKCLKKKGLRFPINN